MVVHCQTFADLIPVTFVLGFYVSIILARYLSKVSVEGLTVHEQVVGSVQDDPLARLLLPGDLHLSPGSRREVTPGWRAPADCSVRGRLMRRTIARYLVVALIQTLRCIDVKVLT